MSKWRRQGWALPTLSAFLTSGLGVTINLATTWKDDWVAWFVVAVLTAVSAWVTVRFQQSRSVQSPETEHKQGILTHTDTETHSILGKESLTTSATTYGLVMRTVITTSSDGTRTETIEVFSREIAELQIKQDPPEAHPNRSNDRREDD